MKNKLVIPKGKGCFDEGIMIDEWIYYSSRDINGLFRYNIQTKEQEFLCRFDKYDNRMGMHENAFRVNNVLFFLPLGHEEKIIAQYDLDSKEMKYIDLPKSLYYQSGRVACTTIECIDAVWVIPCAYDAILRVDKSTYEIKRYDNWPKEIVEHGVSKNKFYGATLVEDKIYMCPYDCPYIVVFDTLTEQMYSLGEEIDLEIYRDIFSYGENLYLIPENISNEILICDLYGVKKEKCSFGLDTEKIQGLFQAMECDEQHMLWMFPSGGKHVIQYDFEKESASVIEVCGENGAVKIYAANMHKYAKKLLVSMYQTSSPCMIVEEGEIHAVVVETTSQMLLESMLDFLNRQTVEKVKLNEQIGEQIYNTIKGKI